MLATASISRPLCGALINWPPGAEDDTAVVAIFFFMFMFTGAAGKVDAGAAGTAFVSPMVILNKLTHVRITVAL